jgi:hypothetical protein
LEDIAAGCLHRVKKLWYERVDDSSDISLLGQAFHKVQHLYILRLVDKGLNQDSEEAMEAFVEGVAISQLPARLIPELRSVWQFHIEAFMLPVSRFVTAEEQGSSGQVSFAPDLVLAHPDNVLEIIDFKSGWYPPLTETELRGNFQARFYSRHARGRWPSFDEYSFTLQAVRFRRSTTVTFTPDELDAVDIEIQAAISTVELAKAADAWPAIPGPACRFCTLDCPVVDNPATLQKRLTKEQYQALGRWMIPADKEFRYMRKLLKEGYGVYGPLDVNGVTWDMRPSVSKRYPVDAILKAFKKLKIDRQAADVAAAGGDLTISASALKKIGRLYPELEAVLEPSALQKTTFRFSAKKPGDDDDDEED